MVEGRKSAAKIRFDKFVISLVEEVYSLGHSPFGWVGNYGTND
jgi:hypothetical protein